MTEDGVLTVGSLFCGSGTFDVAAELAGMRVLWSSEIEPFPRLVTKTRFPGVVQYGDVNAMDGGAIPPVDVITFGSPCTDLSIAGRREGLDAPRSGLFFQAVRIFKEMRRATDGKYPRYAVWENVSSAFSSNKGDDFRRVLECLCQVVDEEVSIPGPPGGRWTQSGEVVGDTFSLAWKQLDAQYFGVPQRRKRIYAVLSLGTRRAGEILFERDGLPWHTPPGFRAGEAPSPVAGGGAEGAGRARLSAGFDGNIGAAYSSIAYAEELSSTVVASRPIHVVTKALDGSGEICLNDQGGERMSISMGVAGTLRAQEHGHPPVVVADGPGPSAGFDGTMSSKTRSIGYAEEQSPTLVAGKPLDVVQPTAFGVCSTGSEGMRGPNPKVGFYEAETSRTLDLNGGDPTCHQGGIAVVEPVAFGVNQQCRPYLYGDGSVTGAVKTTMVGSQAPKVVVPATLKMREGKEGGGKGPLVQEDMSATLATRNDQVLFQPQAYTITPVTFTEVGEEQASPLLARDWKSPQVVATANPDAGPIPLDNHPNDSRLEISADGNVPTLTGRMGTGGNNTPMVAEPHGRRYIVRKLTPTECARLQGMPDWWTEGLGTTDPTEEELGFWMEAWRVWDSCTAPGRKPKTETQVRKWLRDPGTDTAKYKLWGNGIALPCGYEVLQAIARVEYGLD